MFEILPATHEAESLLLEEKKKKKKNENQFRGQSTTRHTNPAQIQTATNPTKPTKKEREKKKKKLRNCSAEQLCFLQQNKSCRKSKAEAHNTNHRERATKKKKKKKKKKKQQNNKLLTKVAVEPRLGKTWRRRMKAGREADSGRRSHSGRRHSIPGPTSQTYSYTPNYIRWHSIRLRRRIHRKSPLTNKKLPKIGPVETSGRDCLDRAVFQHAEQRCCAASRIQSFLRQLGKRHNAKFLLGDFGVGGLRDVRA
jgi:hypothetical protein